MLQKSLLLHHVMMIALMLQGKPPYCLSLHRLNFFLSNCASNRDLSCEEICEKKIYEA